MNSASTHTTHTSQQPSGVNGRDRAHFLAAGGLVFLSGRYAFASAPIHAPGPGLDAGDPIRPGSWLSSHTATSLFLAQVSRGVRACHTPGPAGRRRRAFACREPDGWGRCATGHWQFLEPCRELPVRRRATVRAVPVKVSQETDAAANLCCLCPAQIMNPRAVRMPADPSSGHCGRT